MFLYDDAIPLHAELSRPGGGPCPLCILLHGFTGHMEEPHIRAAADAMVRCGMAVLRVELYGHGQSGGSFREHNLYKWLNNTLTVIDYARGLDFVTDLWLCGHSQGGLTAMLAAGMKADVIRGLIPLSPAVMIPECARAGELLGVRFDPVRIPACLKAWDGMELSGNYIRVAQTIYVEPAIDRFPGPVLVIHGDADLSVPFFYGSRAARRYQNGTLVPVSGDTHCFDRHLDRMVSALETWLRAQLDTD